MGHTTYELLTNVSDCEKLFGVRDFRMVQKRLMASYTTAITSFVCLSVFQFCLYSRTFPLFIIFEYFSYICISVVLQFCDSQLLLVMEINKSRCIYVYLLWTGSMKCNCQLIPGRHFESDMYMIQNAGA